LKEADQKIEKGFEKKSGKKLQGKRLNRMKKTRSQAEN